MHGYELRKRLNLMLGWGRVLSYGSLYPALKKMLRGNLIEEATTTIDAGLPAAADRLPGHRAGHARVRAADVGGRSHRVGGRQLRHPVRVLRPHRHGDPAAGARGPAYPPPGAAGPGPDPARDDPEGGRPVRRRAPAARRRVGRARGALALRPDQRRAHGDVGPTEPATAADRATTTRAHAPEKRKEPDGFGSSSNRGSRQLRHLPDPGRRVLPGRRPSRHRARADARRRSATTTSPTSSSSRRSTSTPRRSASTSPRRPPRRRTTRSRSATCRRSASTVQRGPTLDGLGKYYRETIEEADAEPVDVVAGAARRPGPTSSSPTCRWAPRRPTSSTPSARSTPAWRSSTRCRCSSPPTPCGPRSSRTPASRSSATTSRPRSARPSPTG